MTNNSTVRIIIRKGEMIRDASGRYACPNVTCWRAHQTGHYPDTPTCPNCGIELDWSDVNFDKKFPPTTLKISVKEPTSSNIAKFASGLQLDDDEDLI